MVDMEVDINMEIPIGERVGHGGWLIGPKLFQFEAYPACASSKLCEFIFLPSLNATAARSKTVKVSTLMLLS